MKKNLFTLVMAVFAFACSSLIVSCGNDANELPAPDKGTKGIHRIEATFSGDTENWRGASQYIGYVTDRTFSDLEYKTTGKVGYGEIYDENTGLTYPTAIMIDPVDVVVTTKKECERLSLGFQSHHKSMLEGNLNNIDKSSTLTVTFKSYVDGKLIKKYSKTFVGGQRGIVVFNSVDHSTDGEAVIDY